MHQDNVGKHIRASPLGDILNHLDAPARRPAMIPAGSQLQGISEEGQKQFDDGDHNGINDHQSSTQLSPSVVQKTNQAKHRLSRGWCFVDATAWPNAIIALAAHVEDDVEAEKHLYKSWDQISIAENDQQPHPHRFPAVR